MSSMPKMNLWIDAFNSDTCFLTDEELGIYFRLIFFAWSRGGYLPDDIEFIYCLSKSGNETKIDKLLKLFWTRDGTDYEHGWYQKRLREEYHRAVAITERNRTNGKLNLGNPNETQTEASKSISKSISISNKVNTEIFDNFWNDVCYKISKGQAKRNYDKLPKEWALKPKQLAELYNKYYDALKDKQYAQHPSTWLNAEGYLNQGIDRKEKTEEEMKQWKFKSDLEMRKKGIKPLSWSVQYIRELDEAIANGD